MVVNICWCVISVLDFYGGHPIQASLVDGGPSMVINI